MSNEKLSTGCALSTASLKKREGKKKPSPLNPYKEKGKGKEHRRGSLQNRLSCARMRTRLGEALDAALVLAVGRDGKAAVVTERDADYACRLVRYLVGDLIRAVRETVSESPDEKAKKRIVQIVADAGSGGISRNELTRKTQFIRKSFRDEYLADLIESGELVMTTGTRGMEIYKIGI